MIDNDCIKLTNIQIPRTAQKATWSLTELLLNIVENTTKEDPGTLVTCDEET